MDIVYTRERIRMEVDVTSQDPIVDAITGETPSMWRGTDLAIELAFVYGANGLIDVSKFSSITVEVRDAATRTSQVLATRTLNSGDINSALTADAWQAGRAQHGVWTWQAEETRWDLHGGLSRDYWLVVSAITTDSPPRYVTLGATTLRVVEDGAGEPSNSPLPGDPLYMTAAEVQAAIGNPVRPGNNPDGMTIEIRSPNGQWARIIGVGDDGQAIDTIVQLS